tara:strand:+ start:64 stop:453 length:390 start_codon:yes stop_codon:yes gene_type:complete
LDQIIELLFVSFFYLIIGGTLGVLLRLFLIRKIHFTLGLTLNNTSIVNIISSFLAGIYMAFNLTNENTNLFFSVGFLGCFSTFSSFIIRLFTLIKEEKYKKFLSCYVEVLFYSSLLFGLGYFSTKNILN